MKSQRKESLSHFSHFYLVKIFAFFYNQSFREHHFNFLLEKEPYNVLLCWHENGYNKLKDT